MKTLKFPPKSFNRADEKQRKHCQVPFALRLKRSPQWQKRGAHRPTPQLFTNLRSEKEDIKRHHHAFFFYISSWRRKKKKIDVHRETEHTVNYDFFEFFSLYIYLCHSVSRLGWEGDGHVARPNFMVKHVRTTDRKGGKQKKQTEITKLRINEENVSETTPLPSTAELCSLWTPPPKTCWVLNIILLWKSFCKVQGFRFVFNHWKETSREREKRTEKIHVDLLLRFLVFWLFLFPADMEA